MLSGITFCCLHILERSAFIKTGIVLSLNMLSLCLISHSSCCVDERWLGSHSSTAENRLSAIKPLSYYFIFQELTGCLKEAAEGGEGFDTDTWCSIALFKQECVEATSAILEELPAVML